MLGRRRSEAPSLDDRLGALGAALDAGEGVIADDDLSPAKALLQRAGERLGHGVEHTVVALAGATGSGKSSLFNALSGEELSAVAARRPTTSATHACSWGRDATPLLDWLQVERRHHISDPTGPDGLVLLDLPDHDSVALEHRREVDRIVAVADLVVWVVDPQKYADGALHEQYLRPLAGHAGVLLLCLHQSDLLEPDQLEACRRDLGRLLVEDGLPDVGVVTTSVRTDDGVESLRRAIGARMHDRSLAIERLEADVGSVAGALDRHCGEGTGHEVIEAKARDDVVEALLGAAGVETVTSAVAGSYRSRAVAATGFPATRWLRKLRPDPLRRLHLGPSRSGAPALPSGARTSLPKPTAVTTARAELAMAGLVDKASADVPLVWADAARAEVDRRSETLVARLDNAVATADLGMDSPPRWWRGIALVQLLLFIVALSGALWLTALFALSYLQIDVETPEVGRLPVPTVALAGGVLAGLVVAFLARRLASVGARRRARRARRSLESAVRSVAESEVIGPLAGVFERRRLYCEAVAAAGPQQLEAAGRPARRSAR